MNSKPSLWLMTLVGVLVVCCCFSTVGGVFAVAWLFADEQPVALGRATGAADAVLPTALPPATAGRAAPPRQPVVAGIDYNLVVPTPAAPSMVFPIKFDSRLNVVTYLVSGTNVDAISRSLDANALTDPHEAGGKYYARTDWFLASNWNVKSTARGCEVDRGDVTIVMTVTLPVLSSPNGLTPDLQSRWTKFVGNTIGHETGHVNLSMQGARDYQRALGNYSAGKDCDTLRPKLKALFDDSFGSIDRSNIDYDARTQHGTLQGAVFP